MESPLRTCFTLLALLISSALCSAREPSPILSPRPPEKAMANGGDGLSYGFGIGARWRWGSNGEPAVGGAVDIHAGDVPSTTPGPDVPSVPGVQAPPAGVGSAPSSGGSDGDGDGEPLYCVPMSCYLTANEEGCRVYGLSYDSNGFKPINNPLAEPMRMMGRGAAAPAPKSA